LPIRGEGTPPRAQLRVLSQRVPNNLNHLRGPVRPIPDTCVHRFRTCEILFSSIPHGEGRSPSNGAGWMQASVKSLSSQPTEAFFTVTGPEQAGPHAGSPQPRQADDMRAAVRGLPSSACLGRGMCEPLACRQLCPRAETPNPEGYPASPGPPSIWRPGTKYHRRFTPAWRRSHARQHIKPPIVSPATLESCRRLRLNSQRTEQAATWTAIHAT
jgi:hypothetical protein